MRTVNTHHQETGAVVLIVAMSLMVLAGIAAIALDGGMAYNERRSTQNAADNAALAGAWELCQTGNEAAAEQAALNSAQDNGFTPPEMEAPQVDGDTVTVVIRSEVDTTFGQTQGLSELGVASNARARCIPGGPGNGLFSNAAIVATGTCPTTVTNNIRAGGIIYAAGDLEIKNNVQGVGPVYTEGDLIIQNNAQIYTDVHSNGDLTIWNNSQHHGSSATYVGILDKKNNTSTWNPVQVPAREPVEIEAPYSILDYAPGGSEANAAAARGEYFHSFGIDLKNNITLASGLYYVEGDVSLKNNVSGTDVTIVATGRIDIGNNVTINGTYVEGLALMSTAGSGCGSVAIDVDNNSRIGGTAYAPNGVVDMGNNGSLPGAAIGLGVVLKNNFEILGDSTAWGGGTPQVVLAR